MMRDIARKMVAEKKGILAADESAGTIAKRFKAIAVESTEQTRRQYRELLIHAEGFEQAISGMILFDETLRTPGFVDRLREVDVVPGIKVDQGAKALALHPGEKVTEGLDGLRERLMEYKSLGAEFAKWRAVIQIPEDRLPSSACYSANAHALARYAALCQETGLVPIVEPEVIMDGRHSIETSRIVTRTILHHVFGELFRQGVTLEEMVLKPNMVLAGYDCPEQPSIQEVAQITLEVLREAVPAAVPGIAFLSGGQNDDLAVQRLNAMNQSPAPWRLTYSFGRTLQRDALEAWRGQEGNVAAAQQALLKRAHESSLATQGKL